jgi:hypothetical protein
MEGYESPSGQHYNKLSIKTRVIHNKSTCKFKHSRLTLHDLWHAIGLLDKDQTPAPECRKSLAPDIHLDFDDFVKSCLQSKRCYPRSSHQKLKAKIEEDWGLEGPELDIYNREACRWKDHIEFEHLDPEQLR